MKTRRDTLGAMVGATLLLPFAAFAGGDGHGHKKGDHGKKGHHKGGHGKKGHHDVAGKEVVLKGEVVDLVCYLQHPESGSGPDHAGCAKQCINKGLPPGLLTADGKLYLLMKPGHESAVDDLVPFAAKQVAVTGVVIEKPGMSALVFKSIKRA